MANDYIVQRGDTLSQIAQRRLGRVARWPEIARLNHIPNPSLIFVGQKLMLPDLQPPRALTSVTTQTQPKREPATPVVPQLPANVALARGFLFVVFEQLPEVGTGKIIRKVVAIPRDFSMTPANPLGNLSPAEHVLNTNPGASQFLSASERPFGAPSINGRPMLLDLAKIRQAGGQVYSVQEVVKDLERFVAEHPASSPQVSKLIATIRDIEGEVLIEGGTPAAAATLPSAAHNSYIRSAEELWADFRTSKITRPQLQEQLAGLERAYSRARVLGRVGRVLTVVGIVVTVADVANATQKSIDQKSFRPLGAEAIRQVGGWGGAIGGAKIGAAVGAMFGIETGPGAIVTGALGAIVFGAAGYFGADWVADHISPK